MPSLILECQVVDAVHSSCSGQQNATETASVLAVALNQVLEISWCK